MKLLNLAAIVAGAGIAQVVAVPLLVIPNSNAENAPSTKFRFGHAVPSVTRVGEQRMRLPCTGRRGNRFQQKAVEISNAFRQALGLPLIQQIGGHAVHADGKVMIWPAVGSPTITTFVPIGNMEAPGNRPGHPKGPHHVHRPHHRHHGHNHHHLGKGPFINRIHYSLMNLGHWEGRAVAFVLGCGIGVLIRMFWVLTVLMYRAARGRSSDEHEYTQITIVEEVVDTPTSAPPTYTYPVDEKAVIPVEVVNVPTTTEESK